MPDDSVLEIAIPDLLEKYEIAKSESKFIGFAIAVAGPLCLFAFVFLFGLFPVRDPRVLLEMPLVPTAIIVGFIFLGAKVGNILWTRADIEEKLAQQCSGRDFVINPEGLRCSIAILEGQIRSDLRRSNQPFKLFGWQTILQFIVSPGRHRSSSASCRSVPLYLLKCIGDDNWIGIQRRYFVGLEEEILTLARKYLECEIVVNGDLFVDK